MGKPMRSPTILALLLGLAISGSSAPALAQKADALRAPYLDFLNHGRTPSELLRYALANSEWRVIDPATGPVQQLKAGQRVAFVNQGRTALFVIIGETSLATTGANMVAAHIDTPSPRLLLGKVTAGNQAVLPAGAHGGIKGAHWMGRPLAIVGSAVKADGTRVDIELGSKKDSFAFFIEKRNGNDYKVIASSKPTGKKDGGVGFVEVIAERYTLNAEDLRTSELYLVPKMPARTVGVEKMMIGSHGQDDRSNSFIAWRAISELKDTPERTAIAWLVDREESGSRGRGGARSHFLELVYSYILRAQGDSSVSEAELMRALARTEALSADTPACVNPNWTEVHEAKHAPLLGRGPAMFPGTGHGGKRGGSQAHAELVARALRVFGKANSPVQTAELGRVDEGGGGTVAKYLEHRGIDAVDLGVCVVGMHSPFEIASLQDFLWAYQGFQQWFLAK
ncbi:MAG: hypothetical protein GY811_20050 [Myxococcales bacterium]|nr:hypothetical protein [Myxococcales bacterium]